MIPGQRKRANALLRRECRNYDGGNFLLLDDGEECVCVQRVTAIGSTNVLPQDKTLEAEIFRQPED